MAMARTLWIFGHSRLGLEEAELGRFLGGKNEKSEKVLVDFGDLGSFVFQKKENELLLVFGCCFCQV